MSDGLTLRNFGGIQQLVVATAADLARVDTLDPARWAATSAPLRDLHCDPGFLAFVDTESKGRIRVAELLRARDFCFARLADRRGVDERSDVLLLERLDGQGEEGRQLKQSAAHVIAELKLGQPDRISLADVRRFRAGYAQSLRNGDGVVPPELVPDPLVAAFLREVIGVVGSKPDASGHAGVDAALLDRFCAGAKAFLGWRAEGAARPELRPLGDGTAAGVAAFQALDKKVEEFFLRCELLAQEHVGAEALRLSPEETRTVAGKDAAALAAHLAASSLAPPAPGARLSASGPVNPAFEGAWGELVARVLGPLGLAGGSGAAETPIDRGVWKRVQATFAPHLAWAAGRPAEPFEKIEPERLAAVVEGPLVARAQELAASDLAAGPELAKVTDLEKLVLFQRWLIVLANNFVNFSAIYDPRQTALIQVGSLVIDGRRLAFCTRVVDRGAHKAVAAESLLFLVYAQVSDADGKAPAFEVVAPVTSGERGRLRTGKRGLFVDNAGKEWDATIVEIVEHGISIREAALAPFRRARKLIADRIESFVANQQAAQEKALLVTVSTGTDAATGSAQKAIAGSSAAAGAASGAAPAAPAKPAPAPAPPPPPPPPAGGGMAGIQGLVVGGSLALAALGSALAYVVSAVTSIAPLNLVAGLLGIVAVVAGLSALAGWFKLRRRDMGLLLEASGWAINAEMRLTRRLGVTFTRIPDLPAGTRIDRLDILADDPAVIAQDAGRRHRRRRALGLAVLVGALAAAWLLHRYWPLR